MTSNKAGLQVARFFPKVGHFALIGNPEGKVMLFDILKSRQCVQTYVGHYKAIRDIQFSNDGKHFLSCSFDCKIHYWDTEHGKVVSSYKLKKIPFSLAFHPAAEKNHCFLVGSGNKKILQFDVNTGTKELEYAQHIGTVNTVKFYEENKFISSADDKKLFLWEFGIPVVIKHVSEPEMHTITSCAVHPSWEYYLGQSSDNQIVVYENKGGNFRRIRSKKMASHLCAGYACGIDFSCDGQFVASGDERGRVFFYDWKTSKNYRVLDAHSSVCIDVQFHPNDSNKVLTCGWEGVAKLWE